MTKSEMALKLRPLFVAYHREATVDLIEAYYSVLGKVPRRYVDAGVARAMKANREWMPPPGVLLALCGVPPRCNGDGVPLADESRRLQLAAITCQWHRDPDNWHGDDTPPAADAKCPKCAQWKGRLIGTERKQLGAAK
jgi:hypothetical protein